MNKQILFSDIKSICEGQFSGAHGAVPITALSLDSRKGHPGDGAVYFALRGINHDGHQFIEEAYLKGWRLFVVETAPVDSGKLPHASFFCVNNTLAALQQLVSFHRKAFQGQVIGITGSNGKTIIKEWLFHLLASSLSVVKSPKSYNSQVGVPLSVWALDRQHDLGIFEAGISQPGEMDALREVIQPTIGILTNIGPAHDAFFSSRSQKLEEKMKLFKSCQKLIYCADHPQVNEYISSGALPGVEAIGWGVGGTPAYKITISGAHLKINGRGHSFDVSLPFSDEKSIENLSHCLVASLELEINHEVLARQVASFSAIPMRLSLRDGPLGSQIIDDSYNNDFQGLEAALDFTITHSHGRPIVAIISDIQQAADDPKILYAEVAALLKNKGVSKVIAIGSQLSAHKNFFDIPITLYTSTEAFLKEVDLQQFNRQTILVKGARSFQFEDIVNRLQAKVHRTVLEIDLEALQHNFQFYRSLLKPEVKTMVMLKAFAYGSGGGEIGRTLQYLKADYIAVAYPDEGILLRQQGVHLPIMVMNAPEESFDKLAEFALEPEIFGVSQLQSYCTWARKRTDVPPIHIKLDTGMHRLGFMHDELPGLKEILERNPHIVTGSVFSHLAASENPELDDFTHQQAQTFENGYQLLTLETSKRPFRHLLNTAGIGRFPQYQFDLVRIGLGLHGIETSASEKGHLRPVATLKTTVSQVRKLHKGQTVGYGRAGIIEKDTDVATIAIGYADGYKMALGKGAGRVLVKGTLAPTIGSICMDMTMVNVTGLNVQEGDEVIVFGQAPTVKEIATWAKTIPYEILTSIPERVKREYLSF